MILLRCLTNWHKIGLPQLKTKKIKILLVDDSRSQIRSLTRLIQYIAEDVEVKNIDIQSFYNFTEYLKHRDTEYDIAIIDWNLPDGKGKDIANDLNTDCKYKAIYTGMIDDNRSIHQYCSDNFIYYIPKGSSGEINAFIEEKLLCF